MESNWGRNVHDLGLGSTGSTLAARFLINPNIVLTNATTLEHTTLAAAYGLPDMADTPYVTFVASKGAFDHFPYGYAVEPYVPV